MYYVYILHSLKDRRYYVGYTNDLERRLQDHNRGKSDSVKHRGPFEIVYWEVLATKLSAIHREKQIKNYKGGNAFRNLLKQHMTPSSSLV